MTYLKLVTHNNNRWRDPFRFTSWLSLHLHPQHKPLCLSFVLLNLGLEGTGNLVLQIIRKHAVRIRIHNIMSNYPPPTYGGLFVLMAALCPAGIQSSKFGSWCRSGSARGIFCEIVTFLDF